MDSKKEQLSTSEVIDGPVNHLNRLMFATTGAPSYKLPELRSVKNGKYISFGDDNHYPEWLEDLYFNSSLNNQIINKKIDFIMGEGLTDESNSASAFLKKANRKGESLESIIRKCTVDHEIMGGFCFQVVFTNRSTAEKPEIAEIYYKPIAHFRYADDEYHLKYSKHWKQWQNPKTIFTNPYDEFVMTGTTVYYYNGIYTRDIYPIPSYVGGAVSIATDIEVKNFYYAQTINGMFPSVLLNFFNGEPSEKDKNQIERMLKSKFTGSTKAGGMVVSFNDPRNPHPPTIEPIEANNLDKRFIEMNKEVQTSIFRAHAFSPILLGEATPGKLGQSNEINDARQMFQQDYVFPTQQRILDQFETVLKHNFPNIKLAIEQLRPLTPPITEDRSIMPLLTFTEARALLKKYGVIDAVVPEGDLIPIERLWGMRNPVAIPAGATAVSEAQDTPDDVIDDDNNVKKKVKPIPPAVPTPDENEPTDNAS